MNKLLQTLNRENILIGFVISLGFIASAALLGNSISHLKNSDAISVSGTAEKIVRSDAAKWTFSISKAASQDEYGMKSKEVKDDVDNTIKYLTQRGVASTNIRVLPLVASKLCVTQQQEVYTDNGKDCSGSYSYSLSQKLVIEGDKVDEIQDLSLNAAQILYTKNITIHTESVEFYFNGLTAIKTALLAEAMVNAKERAEALAKSTNNSVSKVKDASQGVFQITAKNSADVSDYGSYDTQSIDKKVTAVVRASFLIK